MAAFAEAWNNPSTLHRMMGRMDRSLKDCEQVLQRKTA